MKSFYVIVLVAVLAGVNSQLQCTTNVDNSNFPREWIDMRTNCTNAMRNQIQKEINASMAYLAMGAHFSRDNVNRLGFAKYFFNAASEEREHAIKLIQYLLMRGELVKDVSNLIDTSFTVTKTKWASGVEALEDALRTESSVTKSIRKVISLCEDPLDGSNFNDYHLSDYLTGEFLEEQYKGQKELADKVSQLRKLMSKHGKLGEFLFDKKLL